MFYFTAQIYLMYIKNNCGGVPHTHINVTQDLLHVTEVVLHVTCNNKRSFTSGVQSYHATCKSTSRSCGKIACINVFTEQCPIFFSFQGIIKIIMSTLRYNFQINLFCVSRNSIRSQYLFRLSNSFQENGLIFSLPIYCK